MKKTDLIFFNNYNKKSCLSEGEINNLPSKTIPNQAYTIQELFDRIRFGESIPVDKRLIWLDDESEIPLPAGTDLTDIDAVKAELNVLTNKIKKAKESIKEKEKVQESVSNEVTEGLNKNQDSTNL